MIHIDFTTKRHFFTASLDLEKGIWLCTVFCLKVWDRKGLKLELTPDEMTHTLHVLSDSYSKSKEGPINPDSFAKIWGEVPGAYNIMSDSINRKRNCTKE